MSNNKNLTCILQTAIKDLNLDEKERLRKLLEENIQTDSVKTLTQRIHEKIDTLSQEGTAAIEALTDIGGYVNSWVTEGRPPRTRSRQGKGNLAKMEAYQALQDAVIRFYGEGKEADVYKLYNRFGAGFKEQFGYKNRRGFANVMRGLRNMPNSRISYNTERQVYVIGSKATRATEQSNLSYENVARVANSLIRRRANSYVVYYDVAKEMGVEGKDANRSIGMHLIRWASENDGVKHEKLPSHITVYYKGSKRPPVTSLEKINALYQRYTHRSGKKSLPLSIVGQRTGLPESTISGAVLQEYRLQRTRRGLSLIHK